MSAPYTVVVCTRDRADQLLEVLAALADQAGATFPVVVVDQSATPDTGVEAWVAVHGNATIVHDEGRGLSRARNLACTHVTTEWVVLLDDDCVPEPGWAEALAETLAAHPEAGFVSGHVGAGGRMPSDYPAVTTFPVDAERLWSGRWTRPWRIGFGVCMAVRRSVVEQLGGWDERLGAGVAAFPAAEDMDFNYRFLKAGGVALATPAVRSNHQQWRSADQLGPLYQGYMTAWAGFAVKHLRRGDLVGGTWLWLLGAADTTRMFLSALRRRSRFRLELARVKGVGLATGTARALRRRW